MTDIMSTDGTKPGKSQSAGDMLAAAHKPETPAKPKIGRPSLYKPEYCEAVVEMGKQGLSPAQIASQLDVDRSTLGYWAEKHHDFSAALARAKSEEQAFWENMAMLNMNEKSFQPSVWAKSMQARFRNDYTERREVTQDVQVTDNTMQSDDVRKVARAILSLLERAEIEALPPVIDAVAVDQDDD